MINTRVMNRVGGGWKRTDKVESGRANAVVGIRATGRQRPPRTATTARLRVALHPPHPTEATWHAGSHEGDDERHGVAFYIAAQEPACGISIYLPEPGGRVIKEGVRVRGVLQMM
jgi:hypothetical protein